jgi:hypothetical protein
MARIRYQVSLQLVELMRLRITGRCFSVDGAPFQERERGVLQSRNFLNVEM